LLAIQKVTISAQYYFRKNSKGKMINHIKHRLVALGLLMAFTSIAQAGLILDVFDASNNNIGMFEFTRDFGEGPGSDVPQSSITLGPVTFNIDDIGSMSWDLRSELVGSFLFLQLQRGGFSGEGEGQDGYKVVVAFAPSGASLGGTFLPDEGRCNEACIIEGTAVRNASDGARIALRAESPVTVPAPAPLALMGLGLLGLRLSHRRKAFKNN